MAETSHNNMYIDNVVASQPELGPSPPDGGYGWMVLLSALITQLSIPSIVVSYGILILYINMQGEDEGHRYFLLWDHSIIMMPVLLVVFSLLTSSWSRIIINISNRPRVVSISGVFLLTASIMLTSLALDDVNNMIIYNVFAGILAGFGFSLTTQQSEVLLKHYFRNKLHIVKTVYKVSILLGNIIITLIISLLFSHYETNIALLIYSVFVWQNCLVLLVYSRPTYITVPLQKNYEILDEGPEDDDEQIYPSQMQSQPGKSTETKIEVDVHKTANNTIVNDDEQDEEIVGSFNAGNTKRQVFQPSAASTSRLETISESRVQRDISNYVYENPENLYKETTVINGEVPQDNLFTFEAPSANNRSNKRTMDIMKNMILMKSVLKDVRFYIYTYVNLCMKFSILVIGVAFPTHLYEQLSKIGTIDMISMTGLIIVIYMGATCINVVSAFTPHAFNRKLLLATFNVTAFAGLLIVAECESKTWLMIGAIMGISSAYGIYMMQWEVHEEMKIERGKTIVMMTSNCVIAMLILLLMFVHDYHYGDCFKVASTLHIMVVIPLLIIRKS